MSSNHSKAGPNAVPAYIMSGVPYVTQSAATEVGGTPIKHRFPFVTKFFQVENTHGSRALRFGFSANGVLSNPTAHYIVLAAGTKSEVLEIRTKELFFLQDAGSSPAGFRIIAGLTTIEQDEFPILTGSSEFEGVG